MRLYEQCRPKQWSEVVGQDATIATIQRLIKRGIGGRCFWISGPSGVGKTTIARLLAAEIAEPFSVIEMDAQQLTAQSLRVVKDLMLLYGWGRGGRALIVNEAHGLRADIVRELNVWLEELPQHALVVFTTTSAGDAEFAGRLSDAKALLSRCHDLRLDPEPPGIAEHVRRIADAEGLNGAPLSTYQALAEECEHNVRAMLNEVETGRMTGYDSNEAVRYV